MLYIVATPIGNLDEISRRALDVLGSVDVIAAEDTRHTAVLLNRYEIKTRVIAHHKFNERTSAPGIIELLESGKDVALVSDAGMPTVSDPGHILIDEVIKRGLDFTVVSGACAAIDALVLSGLDTRSFTVLGFLPEKATDRKKFVAPYKAVPSSLVFYSAVHDIKKDLRFLYEEFGARRVAVCREMTKLYETVTRGVLGDDLDVTETGEFVIVIAGAAQPDFSSLTVEEHLLSAVAAGEVLRDAIKSVAAERHVAKSEVYAVAVKLKADGRLKDE